MKRTSLAAITWLALTACSLTSAEADPLAWPSANRECRPWSYWWWMGSAVDAGNLTRELQRYRDAGWGGVHIIPIYGAKGWETNYLEYLSPRWMAMLRHTLREAERLDLGVDMTTGTGWCFGGPTVTEREANARVIVKPFDVPAGQRLKASLNSGATQALAAYAPDGRCEDLTGRLGQDGSVDWTAQGTAWRVYALAQEPSDRLVKRAAPGGQGHMLNLLFPEAIRNYLPRFTAAFAEFDGPKLRAMYHDSYEYSSDWAPDLLVQFERRRGYRLQTELPALFGKDPSDRAARVRSDYRETVSDVMVEESLPAWVRWCHERGFRTRNQAHGSPGNLLDLYALADIPETEMFHTDRNPLVAKFASSAAHVTGRKLVAAESGTWLKEHFTETLADLKYLLDDLFLSGVNHVIFHGTCYSPDEAAWPGWLFYASTQMNPRNPIWRDVPALAAYIARCQSILQSGQPDNDLLVYWPIHDLWHDAEGRLQHLSVHRRSWFEDQPLGRAAQRLWDRGVAFDYVSDRQLAGAKVAGHAIQMPGAVYRVVVVPACDRMPLDTFEKLFALAQSGATVIFENRLPGDVPGWGNLDRRRAEFRRLVGGLKLSEAQDGHIKEARIGLGHVLVGELEAALVVAGIEREPMDDHPGLRCLRRRSEDGRYYFIANRGEKLFEGWLRLGTAAASAVVMEPLSGRTGVASLRQGAGGRSEVWLQIPAGHSILLRTLTNRATAGTPWNWRKPAGEPVALTGTWQVEFIQGGPQLPKPFTSQHLTSWTEWGSAEAERFAGTARYTITFDAPRGASEGWLLDLGRVDQSARVWINGESLGTVFLPPFRVLVERLKPRQNVLEVEVTNLAANRIRDLDRRKVNWKHFHDINFVNIQYKPFDASAWPLTPSGLLGPVRLWPAEKTPARE